ncbi:Retrovirus-related Pol polyprotein from transposon TNT 1-94, partial [Glycine soja]
KVEELQGSLEAHEQRLIERSSEKKYLSKVLKKFKMMGCKPVETPAELNVKLVKSEDEGSIDGTMFREIVGSLKFICHSKPEMAFNVGLVNRFMSDPRQPHLIAVKGIMSSKKQTIVALSTCEAKYIAACVAACQALWLSSLLEELEVFTGEAVDLLEDNKSTIDLAKNPVSHGRSKHIDTKCHFLKDQVSKGKIRLQHCRTEKQLADIMTKSLKNEMLKELREFLNVVSF